MAKRAHRSITLRLRPGRQASSPTSLLASCYAAQPRCWLQRPGRTAQGGGVTVVVFVVGAEEEEEEEKVAVVAEVGSLI